jgi:perosamine synthetase
MSEFVPVNEPLLYEDAKRYLIECIDTGWVSADGHFVRRFENELAARVGRKHGVAVCNGSAALDVAVAALRLDPGDEVILPSFTIISCAAAILRSGGVPVIIDTDPITWNMRVDQIEARVSPRTKAIMAVHIYGLPIDMEPLLRIAQKYGLKVIEDAAEALGAEYNGKACGSFGDVSVFSFYSNKPVTSGEGGMVVTDDADLADRCRSLRNLCFRSDRRFIHDELGWNLRMSNIQAALGVAQLAKLDEVVSRKRKMGLRYRQLLKAVPGLQHPLEKTALSKNSYWVYGLVLTDDVDFDAAEAMRRLARLNVQTRPFFWPMHKQPVFQRMGLFAGESYPISERIARRGFYLPSGLALTDTQMTIVADAVAMIFR